MKKIICIFAAAVLLIKAQPLSAFDAGAADFPEISAKAAVVISADTGETVFAHNADTKLPMASTTKIMTVLLCLESGGLDEEFVVDSEAIKVEGSSMGLREGDIVTKYALCCGMLLPSGNDAANAAAVKISGSIEEFAKLMNERARQIGISRTFFVTPSGLEGEGHGSSARDMAILAREALRNEIFREICSKSTIEVEFGAPPYKRRLKNTNKLLTMYDGVYGVKTGFTDEAGRCLVSACERDGKSLICVTLNDRNDWDDHMALYDYAFERVTAISPQLSELPCLDLAGGGECDTINLKADDAKITITSAGVKPEQLEYTVLSPPFIYAPVLEGEQLAMLRISFGGREIAAVPLYAADDVKIPDKSDCPGEKINIFKKIFRKLRSVFS